MPSLTGVSETRLGPGMSLIPFNTEYAVHRFGRVRTFQLPVLIFDDPAVNPTGGKPAFTASSERLITGGAVDRGPVDDFPECRQGR